MNQRLHAGVVVLLLAVTCRQQAEVRTTADEQKPAAPSAVPQAWSDLGLPTAGLHRVLPETDEHGFYADYVGLDRETLLGQVSHGLANAGFSQSCTAVDGMVLGFSNGRRELALKIDLLPEPSLSLFDGNGIDPILHGLCFGRYSEGPWRTLTQEEKEALAGQLEAGDGEPDSLQPDKPGRTEVH